MWVTRFEIGYIWYLASSLQTEQSDMLSDISLFLHWITGDWLFERGHLVKILFEIYQLQK
jgi:hypothetical protein